MNSLPLVTIYITNYNYGKYLEKAIESVLKQTYKNIEIYIIDDGSTDNSRTILEKYYNIPTIKIVYQQNKGLIVSNNISLRLANGKYIMRLDADDYLDSNAVSIMVAELESDEQLGLIYPNYFIINENDEIINYRIRNNEENNQVKDIPSHGACTLIRKEFLDEIGGYNEQYTCQDGFYLWVNFINRYKVKNIETPLFYYRQHGTNLTENKDRIFNTRSKIINEHINLKDFFTKKTIAILPIRGPQNNINSIALKNLGDKKILQWKINETLKSDLIDKLIISTPDDTIINFLNENYFTENRVIVHKRPAELAILNIGLGSTIDSIFEEIEIGSQSFMIILTIRFPFLKYRFIDSAIKSCILFDTDSVLSVRPDNNRFFQKSERGLIPIFEQDKFTKLEREDLYRYSGGIILTKIKYYLEQKKIIGGKIGHIIVDEIGSFNIKSELDLKIAEFLVTNNLLSL